MHNTDNLRIKDLKALVTPGLLIDEIPITNHALRTVNENRQHASNIIHGQDDRLLAIIGPCSIHDPSAALEYANKLAPLIKQYSNELCIIMRVYFEKPRTTVGWKGLINDPYLDSSFQINHGLRIARQLLLDINNLGIATGSEFLDTIIPQYISDLTSWSAIGARTSESQIHRELASGLSMPVGFKNGTTGNMQIAVDAVYAAQNPHHFLGVSKQGVASIVSTTGNPDCHIILRGSSGGTNYDNASVGTATELLSKKQLTARVMIDCSHGNSNKDHTQQIKVVRAICEQVRSGSRSILGLMLESNLVAGKQTLTKDKKLTHGQSITDACIDLAETAKALEILAQAVNARRNQRERKYA